MALNGAVLYEVPAGGSLELEPRSTPTKAEHTALSFEVDDLEANMRDLEQRGVQFEDYDLPELKTENKIASMGSERAAWFKDPEGNILCIHAHTLGLSSAVLDLRTCPCPCPCPCPIRCSYAQPAVRGGR